MKLGQITQVQLFDWKYNKILNIVPVIMFGFTFALILISGRDLHVNLERIQTLYLPWISWSAILYFQPLHDQGAYYTLVPFYRRWFSFNLITLIVIYGVGYLILIISLSGAFELVKTNPIIIIHHILLLFLYWGLGSALILITRSFEYSSSLVFTYTLIESITRGEFMPWPHIFQFNEFYGDTLYTQKVSLIVVLTIVFLTMSIARLFRRS